MYYSVEFNKNVRIELILWDNTTSISTAKYYTREVWKDKDAFVEVAIK